MAITAGSTILASDIMSTPPNANTIIERSNQGSIFAQSVKAKSLYLNNKSDRSRTLFFSLRPSATSGKYFDLVGSPDGSYEIRLYNSRYYTFMIKDKGQNTRYWATFSSSSSREYKTNITALPSMHDKLMKLRPVSFIYKNDPTNKTQLGLIYEETINYFPELCIESSTGQKGIHYAGFVPVLIKEIQELRARIDKLKAKRKEGGET